MTEPLCCRLQKLVTLISLEAGVYASVVNFDFFSAPLGCCNCGIAVGVECVHALEEFHLAIQISQCERAQRHFLPITVVFLHALGTSFIKNSCIQIKMCRTVIFKCLINLGNYGLSKGATCGSQTTKIVSEVFS